MYAVFKVRYQAYSLNLTAKSYKPMGLSGLEPPTSRLSGVRSNQLSYKPMFEIFRFHPDLPHAIFPEPSEQVPRSRESSYASTSASISGSKLSPISASFCPRIRKILRGDEEIRTLDPLLARQVLSQLSYIPI